MPIDEKTFRAAMGNFACGVTVVTTEHEGVAYGMTVASFASLSLRPPLVLVCIEKNVKSHDVIAASGKFAVNVLRGDQAEVSNRFASRTEDKFAGSAVGIGETGAPILTESLASFDCRVTDSLPGGDHTIFVGEVVWTELREGEPLLYFRSSYRALA